MSLMLDACKQFTDEMSTELNLLTLSENDVPGAKFTGIEVEEHTNIQLKRWLECRGLKKTGKRADLIQR